MSKNQGLSLVNEFENKKNNVRARLKKNFICCVKVNGTNFLIAGGDEMAGLYRSPNFAAIVTGGSSGDIAEGVRNVRRIVSSWATTFSSYDVHCTILRDDLARLMKIDLEDKDTARGLAAEFAIVDILGRLVVIYFTGDYHFFTDEDQENDSEAKIFVAGCYDLQYRKKVTNAVSRLFSKLNKPDEKVLKEIQLKLIKKLKIESCSIICLDVVVERLGDLEIGNTKKKIGKNP